MSDAEKVLVISEYREFCRTTQAWCFKHGKLALAQQYEQKIRQLNRLYDLIPKK